MKTIALAVVLLIGSAPVALAQETYVNRARVIIDRLEDDSSPLNGKATAVFAEKIADAYVLTHGKHLLRDANGNPVALSAVANEDKARVFVNEIRKNIRDVYHETKGPVAADSARETARSEADTELDAGIGTEE